MSCAHSKENQSLCIISSWLSSKFFDLTLHLLFFPLTGTVHCILPTIRLCSYNRSYLICFYMDQWWGCCISFGEWAEGSRAWPASPCKDQRICRCSSSKLQWLAMQSSGGLLLSPRSGLGSGRRRQPVVIYFWHKCWLYSWWTIDLCIIWMKPVGHAQKVLYKKYIFQYAVATDLK